MDYIGQYIFLFIVVALGCIFRKEVAVNILQCVVVCAFFACSKDPMDYYNYENLYYAVNAGETVYTEIGYVWFNKLIGWFGYDYVAFRYVIGLLFCAILSIAIRKLTASPNVVWSLYIVFSAMFDASLLRNSMAMACGVIAIVSLIQAKETKDYIWLLAITIVASLFHSAYWIFLGFIALWKLVNTNAGVTKVLVGVGCLYVICMLNNNILFSVYANLWIREATIDKYATGEYSNVVGIVYTVVKYIFVISPVLYYKNNLSNPTILSSFKKKPLAGIIQQNILKLNIIFSIVLVPQFFAVNYSRLFRLLILFNYIFIANQIGKTPKSKIAPMIYGLAYSTILLLLMLFWESKTTLDDIWYMHMKTNQLLNLFF